MRRLLDSCKELMSRSTTKRETFDPARPLSLNKRNIFSTSDRHSTRIVEKADESVPRPSTEVVTATREDRAPLAELDVTFAEPSSEKSGCTNEDSTLATVASSIEAEDDQPPYQSVKDPISTPEIVAKTPDHTVAAETTSSQKTQAPFQNLMMGANQLSIEMELLAAAESASMFEEQLEPHVSESAVATKDEVKANEYIDFDGLIDTSVYKNSSSPIDTVSASQPSSDNVILPAIGSQSRRRADRIKLAVPTHVVGYDRDGNEWTEVAETVDVSPIGALLRMSRRPRQSVVLRLTLPLPEKLRQYALEEPNYTIYAVVRRVDLARGGVRKVGVEFIGEHPPDKYAESPWAAITEMKWSGRDRRLTPREPLSSLVWIEYLTESLYSLGIEAARTEDVSGGGLRLQVRAAPADCEVVRVRYSNSSFDTFATIRSRFAGSDGNERLCLRFLDARPVHDQPTGALQESIQKPTSMGKVLLADDDAALRKVLGSILMQAGYEVTLAEDGSAAIEKARIENPDVVISDLLMPKTDGFTVCRTVKSFASPPRVILLSGVFTKPNYQWEARDEYGADDMVTKPFVLADLLERVKKQISVAVPA